MKLGIIFASVIGAIALVTLGIGLVLPAKRTATNSRLIAASPETLKSLLLDVESQRSWRKDIVSVERTPDGWIERNTRKEAIAFRAGESSGQTIRLTFLSNRGYHGAWTGVLKQEGSDHTRITVTEQATTPSPVGRVLSRLFFDPDAFTQAYLDALQQAAENKQAPETVR